MKARIETKMHEVTSYKVEDFVVLTLTREEAECIADLTAFVGGDPVESRRRIVADLSSTLFDAGVSYSDLYNVPEDCASLSDISGNIAFRST